FGACSPISAGKSSADLDSNVPMAARCGLGGTTMGTAAAGARSTTTLVGAGVGAAFQTSLAMTSEEAGGMARAISITARTSAGGAISEYLKAAETDAFGKRK